MSAAVNSLVTVISQRLCHVAANACWAESFLARSRSGRAEPVINVSQLLHVSAPTQLKMLVAQRCERVHDAPARPARKARAESVEFSGAGTGQSAGRDLPHNLSQP